MSKIRTADKLTEIEYKVNPVRANGQVVALEIARWTTTTQLSANGNRKRGTDHEFDFEDIAVIAIEDVPELMKDITRAISGALSDTERGLV